MLYHGPMANPSRITPHGAGLLIHMDDGSIFQGYKTGSTDFAVALVSKPAAPVDPTPDPGPDPTPGDWQWPFQYSRYVIQSGYYAPLAQFGWRVHPIYHTRKLHMGLDFGAAGIAGQAIPCASAGTVSAAGYNGSMGNHVIVEHAGGLRTRYFHMVKTPDVKTGQKVTKGQKLGNVGNTGASVGSHLHWETWEGGAAVDPRAFMKRRGVPES